MVAVEEKQLLPVEQSTMADPARGTLAHTPEVPEVVNVAGVAGPLQGPKSKTRIGRTHELQFKHWHWHTAVFPHATSITGGDLRAGGAAAPNLESERRAVATV